MKTTKPLCKLLVITLTITLLASSSTAQTSFDKEKYSGSWAQVADIVKQVSPPTFPDKDFNIKDFGAVDNAKKDSRKAIISAIKACAKAGGGRVVVPAGTYLSNGPIHLESNIDFHLAKGSKILFGKKFNDYLPPVLTRWECTRIYNYSPFIYAYQKTNIALTGKGTLDGQAKDTWQAWSKNERAKDTGKSRKMNDELTPLKDRVFAKGSRLRPAMIQFYECRNILVEDISILDSPFWCVHPVFSKNITVRNIRFTAKNPNNDGIDIDSCQDVYIHDIIFDNHDDCIAIKSGRGAEGRQLAIPTHNVYIRDCVFNAYTAIAIGSEMGGSIYNIFAENSHAESKCKRAFNIKGNRERGGEVSHIRYRNMQFLDTSNEMLIISGTYSGDSDADFPPYYHDIRWEDIDAEGPCSYALRVMGQHDVPVENVVLKNINVRKAKKNKEIKDVKNLITQNVTLVDEKLPNAANLPPDVYAGPDQAIETTGTITLQGNVTDDGNPSDKLTYKWSVIQGDAKAVKFDSPKAITTKAAFAKKGTYIIKLTANDSRLDGYHFLMVEVGNQKGISAVKKPIFQHSKNKGNL